MKRRKKSYKKKKKLSIVKQYPYFYLLLLSGFCVAMYYCVIHTQSLMQRYEVASQAAEGGTQVDTVEAESEDIDKQEEKAETTTAQMEETEKETIAEQEEKNETEIETETTTEQEKTVVGVTEYTYYDKKAISSPYYQDPGKIALTTKYPYSLVDDSYFSDAAFIGDSRTLGLYDYSGLPDTDFYCDDGFCTYLWSKGKDVVYQNENRKVLLDDMMDTKTYKKIYVMLGLNDCGYGNIDDFQKRYSAMLTMLHNKQPDAIIYLLANLHLSEAKSDSDNVYNNDDVNAHNVAIAELADGITYFYLDSNDLFINDQGFLKADLTFDGVHLYADGYQSWMNYFKQHAVVR